MSGWLKIVGLGPGSEAMVTPEVTAALLDATDVVGYVPYVNRVAPRAGLVRHGSDNREEIRRAEQALQLALEGHRVVVVSSGDPGVFAMAAAVFEALEAGDAQWRALDIQVLPGISAMLAASASVGAPLGHDFCCINLSDNLKPWALIEKRLRLAAEADFAMAFYNPRSKARPAGFERTLDVLQEACGPDRLIIFARAVSTPEESVRVTTLGEATPDMADMRTLVIVGSQQTRLIERSGSPLVYTPRSAD
ncbi:precorrin-3B C(17)-methyltransferase [Halomonas sp. FeN2]|uniref:Precorrin-3B C(17)-methyltransferase n=1 Tax=Vreelandella neptunia TaxID=115551 RepID=A0ABZ0YFH6_9GAMM|nr:MULTISPECIES: precorrin-3B C(17)-methyltransferase [Halomonas]TDV94444.1 precorrin-3 methyltransferase [Halomonas alkaliantarctica]MBF58664.1 precorrin-3B C(17)-methyltransferase [Halomonas sp.]MDN3560068.1 precorrin-3B C(17)-methyltransferase [Halomonas neptunia]UBR50361.1 precorrin-3B C(17)-methyltransferase [Halomonas sp. FeN2]WQH10844.1 precorrin-3B C(17)-methyltransferase [Halomonas neptunia]|tara:strand:+ start:235 stop:984 length:750 start_codon:yes stop_codon:yes gene_type:complete